MVLLHGLVHAVGDAKETAGPIANLMRQQAAQREQWAREDALRMQQQQQNAPTQAQIKLAITEAAEEANGAQADALVAALRAVAPNHPLLKENGRINKAGNRMTNLGAIWIQKFDETIRNKLGSYAGDPSRFRGV